MKTELHKTNRAPTQIKFPVLARWAPKDGWKKITPNSELVVLFDGERSGMAVHAVDSTSEMGHYSTAWININSGEWEILAPEDKITLSNG